MWSVVWVPVWVEFGPMDARFISVSLTSHITCNISSLHFPITLSAEPLSHRLFGPERRVVLEAFGPEYGMFLHAGTAEKLNGMDEQIQYIPLAMNNCSAAASR